MFGEAFRSLINNAIILVVLSFLHQQMVARSRHRPRLSLTVASVGVLSVTVAVMTNPWHFGQGIVFDTRTVVLSLSGLFFGFIPTVVAVSGAVVLRIFAGGSGMLMGVATVVTAAAIGLGWRYIRKVEAWTIGAVELYLAGIVVHLNMLAWTLLLPTDVQDAVRGVITWPVLIIYPLLTVVVGGIMSRQLEHANLEDELYRHRSLGGRMMDTSPVGIVVFDATGHIVTANDLAAAVWGAQRADMIGARYDAESWHLRAITGEDVASDQLPVAQAFHNRTPVMNRRFATRTWDTGETRYVSINAAPMIGPAGEVDSVVTTIQDITADLEAQGHIKRLSRVYALLSNVNKTIVRISDPETLYRVTCVVAVADGEFLAAAVSTQREGENRIRVAARAGENEAARAFAERFGTADLDTDAPVAVVVRSGTHLIITSDNPLLQDDVLARDAGIASAAILPIRRGDSTCSVITVCSSTPDFFDGEELQLLYEMCGDIAFALEYDASKQREQETLAALRRSLEEKTVLLREVHHRVKNNLTIIASLLNLQSQYIHTPKQAFEALATSRNRVFAMARVHEALYESTSLTRIRFGRYLRTMASELVDLHGLQTRVDVVVHPTTEQLSIDQALPCALIFQELFSNAMKHAFVGREHGTVSVSFTRVGEQTVELRVVDDGIGMTGEAQGGVRESLGFELIRVLTSQLNGTLSIDADAGTSVAVRFAAEQSVRRLEPLEPAAHRSERARG